MTLKPLDGNSATVNADRRETERESRCVMQNEQQTAAQRVKADVAASRSGSCRSIKPIQTPAAFPHTLLLLCWYVKVSFMLCFSPGKEITVLFGIDLLHHRFIPNQQQLCKTAALSNLPASVIYRLWDLINALQWERFELNFLMRFQISFFPVSHFFS